MDTSEMISSLKSMGIPVDKLTPEKIDQLSKISQEISDPTQMNMDQISKILEILNIQFSSKKETKNLVKKIGPNEKCPCQSQLKWKKCCGKQSNK